MLAIIICTSLLLQLSAIYNSLRLIKVTGSPFAWSIIAGGISLMAIRRMIDLTEFVIYDQEIPGEIAIETMAMTISGLLAIGIARVRPIFERIRSISEQLRESEDKYRSVVNAMAAGLVLQDDAGRIVAANPAAERILGRKEHEMIGLLSTDPTWRTVYLDGSEFHGDDHPVSVTRKTGSSQREIVMGIHQPAGSLRWLSVNSEPIFDSVTGNTKAVVVTFQDITQRINDLKEKEDLQLHLQQTQKMESIGRLAGGIAHDFNNMLGAILGFTELAQIQVREDQKPLGRYLGEVHKAASRSADLTHQLLTFARKQPTVPKVIDINASVENMQSMLQRIISKNVSLIWTPGTGVWPVMIDPSQLDQILTNLCVNARDAVGVTGTITIETENESLKASALHRAGEFVRLSVIDNGKGMDRNTVSKIFEPFFTSKGAGKGTGLGLATVYGIVEQNNGFIKVDSMPGLGSAFNIFLPRHIGPPDTKLVAHRSTPLPHGNERILLVEDESAILDLVKTTLDACGYTVIATQNPQEALKVANDYPDPIDLVITDIIMPEINGWELSDSLAASHPNMRCLFMSGYSGDVIHDELEIESFHFISKPFAINDLATKVREVLDA